MWIQAGVWGGQSRSWDPPRSEADQVGPVRGGYPEGLGDQSPGGGEGDLSLCTEENIQIFSPSSSPSPAASRAPSAPRLRLLRAGARGPSRPFSAAALSLHLTVSSSALMKVTPQPQRQLPTLRGPRSSLLQPPLSLFSEHPARISHTGGPPRPLSPHQQAWLPHHLPPPHPAPWALVLDPDGVHSLAPPS